ncbi:Stress enhanced protein 1, chloroplastic [Vitis vinifera]|uniref:Stress enhanced protein 1, chloroplastic n=1 Tax=Vitis vinifera TaxID=29760 RepID=A0A438FN87_VITVI|nr:Stress enhanced protein 1, chloroplastic [Vitis vinifera]
MGSSGVIWIGHVSVTQLENVWSSSTATTPLVEKTLKKEINIERAVWLRTSNILKRPWHHLNSLPQPPPPSTPASPPMYVLQALQEPFPLHAYPFRVWLEFELRLPPALHSMKATGRYARVVKETDLSSRLQKPACRATSVSIRCEQSANEGNSLDVWLGRLAMVGFAVAISVEITTGKGLLENFGLTSPLPTVALAVTALVGVLTAVFIFQSASKN